MTLLALIRNGVTEWNETHLVQGRSDIPLSPSGRDQVRGWTLPKTLDGFDWVTSPLSRAKETAEILSGGPVPADPRLAATSLGAVRGRSRWTGPSGKAARCKICAASSAI